MVRLHPFLLASLLLVAAALPGATRTLLCLGDSLTAGYGLDEHQAWPALLQARLDHERLDWRVINAGVSGDTTAGARRRLDWLLKTRPTAAFVCLGGNDGLRGVDLGVTEANLNVIVGRLKRAGAVVWLGGMDLPVNLGPDYRAAFRELFPRVARTQGVELFPFLLKDVAGRPELNLADGIHPTAEGHAIVARNLADFLLPRLRAFKDAPDAVPVPPRVLRRRSDLGA
jgi:acyl-CoA thioesterase-1